MDDGKFVIRFLSFGNCNVYASHALPTAQEHISDALFAVLFCPYCASQIGSGFWRVHGRFSTSGQNNPSLWAEVSNGDTLLDYQHALLSEKDTVLKLINPEVGPAGVEGDKPVLGTSSLPANRGKRKRVLQPAFQALVDSSASTAASAAKYARFSELVALSTTLKNARDADFRDQLFTAIKTQFEGALRSSAGSPFGASRDRQGSTAAAGPRADAEGQMQDGQRRDGSTSGRCASLEAPPDVEGAGSDDRLLDGEEP